MKVPKIPEVPRASNLEKVEMKSVIVEIESTSPNYSVIFRLVSIMNAFGFV